MVELAGRRAACRDVRVHAFLDGRDTPPRSAARVARRAWTASARGIPARASRRIVRPLLRDGPRPALGPRRAGLRRCWSTATAPFAAPTARAGPRRRLRARRERRVRASRPPSSTPTARRPRMSDGDVVVFMNFRADRAREITRALTDPAFDGFARARVPALARLRLPHVATATNSRTCRSRSRRSRSHNSFGEYLAGPRPDPAAHRRDREVRARDVLLQRRRRGRLPGRGPHPGAVAEGRDLRPEAGDERARGHRQAGRGDRERPLRRDRLQLRQRRHGRPHRQLRRRRSGRSKRSTPASAASSTPRARSAAKCSSPPTTATPR